MIELKTRNKSKTAFTRQAFVRCLALSGTLLAIAWLFEMARLVITAEIDALSKLLFFFAMWLVLGVVIWLLTFINPEFMERIARTLGFERDIERRENS